MQLLVMSMIVISTTFDYFVLLDWLPGPAKYVIELVGSLVLLIVVALGAGDRFRFVRPAYWFVFGALALTMVCGILENHVEVGPLFAGLRTYLRAIPLFFLAAVTQFSERQIKQQLLLLLGIAIVQLPLAVHQRMSTLAYGGITGDLTFGTLTDSTVLSIFLIAGIAILMGLYLKKLISTKLVLVLFLCLVVPTTINETKGTLVLLPLAMGVVFILGAKPGVRLKNTLVAIVFLSVFAAIFVPIYDSLIAVRPYPITIKEFFTNPHAIESYFSNSRGELGVIPEGQQAGRGDAIVVPLVLMARDPVDLVFGLGAGNASHSQLGPQFTGRYFPQLGPFILVTGMSLFEAELGLLGLLLLIGLYWLIYSDCRVVAASGTPFMSGLALGWAGVTAMIIACLPYKALVPFASMSFLFWYFSGLIAAERMRLAKMPVNVRRVARPKF
jgi:hypothetical protein